MKILVTGGAGFIGSNFCRYVIEKYPTDEVVCLDALTYAGNLENLNDIIDNERFNFIKGNICDEELVDNLFSKEMFDVVVNFAAESDVDRSIINSKEFLMSNIIGVQTLMDACVKYNVKKFHQISTDEVYGDLPLSDKGDLFYEYSPLRATNPYSVSKASADLLVLSYHRIYKLPVTISRCSNNYGPYQFPEKLIPLTITKIFSDEKIPVHGKGNNIRDWIHVYDHCSAVDLIIRKGTVGEIYNIGANCQKQNIDVVKTILKEMDKEESMISYVEDRPGNDLRYALSNEKIKKELNWEPLYTFEEGLRSTIEWYKNNREWFNNIAK